MDFLKDELALTNIERRLAERISEMECDEQDPRVKVISWVDYKNDITEVTSLARKIVADISKIVEEKEDRIDNLQFENEELKSDNIYLKEILKQAMSSASTMSSILNKIQFDSNFYVN